MPTYYLTGLMYINGCHDTEDQRVLIPDGSSGDIVPPLAATILVAATDHIANTFATSRERTLDVDGQPTTFFEFPLKKRSLVSLPHSGGAKCVKLDAGLPRAEDADFIPNLKDPDTIAEIELGGGTLKARALAGVPIVEWTIDDRPQDDRSEQAPTTATVPDAKREFTKDNRPNDDHSEQVTITATLLDDKREPTDQQQTLTVKHDATVVFVHSSDLFAEAPQDDWGDEWGGGPPTSGSHPKKDHSYTGAKLYSKIAVKEVDPEKFYAHREPRDLQDNIPDNMQAAALNGLKHRPGWVGSDPPWCCPTTLPPHH